MKKIRILALAIACVTLSGILSPISAFAGKGTTISSPVLEEDNLNQTSWYFLDSNIVSKDGILVIPSDTSTADTRFIAKDVSKVDSAVKEITSVDMKMRLTALPNGQKFILAFGLPSLEAYPEQMGNVEMIFSNEGGLKLGIVAYTENGAETVSATRSCGISMNKEFSVDAVITSDSVLIVKVNGSKVCQQKLPVSGEGRFGVLQTGSCGAEISELTHVCSYYETPENTNISEDFENGDFNVNTLYSTSKGNGLYPSAIKVDEYNGSKVLRFQNTGWAYLATKYKYSNFELSFDIPYFSRETVYDDNGVLIGKPCDMVGISWGSEQTEPTGYGYVHDIDLIALRSSSIRSEVRSAWNATLADLNVTDLETNEGYSIKFTVVDGHTTFQVKSLTADKYITIGEADYELQRSGYIFIWSAGSANCAIDNLKITNLDNNPNLVEVERESSLIIADDYELTEEEKSLVFRDDTDKKDNEVSGGTIFLVCCSGGAVLLAAAGIVMGTLLKKRKQKGGE